MDDVLKKKKTKNKSYNLFNSISMKIHCLKLMQRRFKLVNLGK